MSDYTKNYNLKKPLQDDFYDIEDFNGNTDIIDEELKKLDTSVKALDTNKVAKITGKGLSTHDFTAEYQNKINNTETTLSTHRQDSNIHVTKAEKDKWNNISNPNLLINGDFKIWQRGDIINIASGIWIYTADRFRATGIGTIEKRDNGLYVSNASSVIELQYILENEDYNKLLGKMVTVSYSKNNTVYKLYSTTVAGELVFSIDLSRGDTLNWVKLEMGAHQTPFVPSIYAEEFAKCQRYYRETPFMVSGHSTGEVVAYGHVNKLMRIEPRTSVKSLSTVVMGKVDLLNGIGSGAQVDPFIIMSNVGISRAILVLPVDSTGMQGILIEDAEIY